MNESWVALAHVIRPQGRKGEMLAELLTDFPERLAGRPGLYLAREGFAGSESEARPCTITALWMPKGRNEGRVVVALEGVATIDAAEAVAGYDVLVRAGERIVLEEGAAYINDLVGCSVFDRDRLVGLIKDVEFPTSADGRRRLEEMSPLLVVALPDGSEAMIPFTKAFVRDLDAAAKVLRMELPAGLVELSEAIEGEGDAAETHEGEG